MGKLLSLITESRAHPSQKTNWALYGFSAGQGTASGITINEEKAMGITAVYACLRVLSETVGSLPVHLFRRISDQKRERATNHPYYKIIHSKPNPEMVSMVFRETMMLHLNTWGNFYGNNVWSKQGKLLEIWPLRPDRMRPERAGNTIQYIYTLESGEERIIPNKDVLHIPGLGFDGLVGYSPIAMNKEAIALAKAAEEFGARFFANDARPGIVLKHPGELSQPAQERLRNNWEKMHTGLENKHRLAVLEEGLDIQTIGIPPQEAQWIELRSMQLTEIARIYRIPPPLIGDLSRATFSNVEELTRHFGIHTIRPWLTRIEAIMNANLLEGEDENLYIEHLMDALLRADIGARYSSYATGRQWGWLSANDVRRLENMDAIEEGDIYLTPGNMVPAGEEGKEPEKEKEEPGSLAKPKILPLKMVKSSEDDEDVEERISGPELKQLQKQIRERVNLQKSFKPLFDSCFQKIVNREYMVLDKLIKKGERASLEQNLERSLDEFYAEDGKFRNFVRDVYKPALDAYASSVQAAAASEIGDPEALDDIGEFTEGYFQDFADQYVRSSRNQLDYVVEQNPENKIDAIFSRINTWSGNRALGLANDQLVRVNNAVAEHVFFFSALTASLIWLTTSPNPCPYCRSLHGRTIRKTEKFVTTGETLGPFEEDSWWDDEIELRAKKSLFVRAGKSHPPIHKGCECAVTSKKETHRSTKDEEKVRRALESHKPVDSNTIQDATLNEERVVQLIGKKAFNFNLHQRNFMFDVGTGSFEKPTMLVEVKTLMNQKNDKLTMHSSSDSLKDESLQKKKRFAAMHPEAKIYTVAFDNRPVRGDASPEYVKLAKKGKAGYFSGNEIYVREGIASYRLHNMNRVTENNLKDILQKMLPASMVRKK